MLKAEKNDRENRDLHLFFEAAKRIVQEIAHGLIVHIHQTGDLLVCKTLIKVKLYNLLLP